MPRQNRSEVFEPGEIGTYHLINRCVRQAFLCGVDEVSGRSYEHRKGWVKHRLALLSSAMAVDVLGFCVMSNHIHAIVRNRPDVASQWSPAEIARRWLIIYPPGRSALKKTTSLGGTSGEDRQEAAYQKAEAEIVKDSERVEVLRARLSSPSWFMKCLAEKVAREANKEENVTGRFWEGRFKMHRLLDEWAVTACMMYVDLNPIRAGLADGIASSPDTSIFIRLSGAMRSLFERLTPEERVERGVEEAFVQRMPQLTQPAVTSPTLAIEASLHEIPTSPKAVPDSLLQTPQVPVVTREVLDEAGRQSAFETETSWLAPLEITTDERSLMVPVARASNLGCLEMTLSQYIELLEWTGRHWKATQVGCIPANAPSVLERLQLDGESWIKLVQGFRGKRDRWRRTVSRPEALQAEAQRRGAHWIQGISLSRTIFPANPVQSNSISDQ
ncbi:MAG: transposase [Planctomycetaceae bacterium]